MAEDRTSIPGGAFGPPSKPGSVAAADLGWDTRALMKSARLSRASLERDETRQHKRSNYFLKGPLPFQWIRENIPDPASRLILVARAFMDMERDNECHLTGKVWDCAGVEGKDKRRRTLAKVRRSALGYSVISRPGRPCILQQTSFTPAP